LLTCRSGTLVRSLPEETTGERRCGRIGLTASASYVEKHRSLPLGDCVICWPSRRLVQLGGALQRTSRSTWIVAAVRRRHRACRSETLLASPVRRMCSSPCFPDTAAGSSNASHEVWSPTALSGCVALSRGGQPFRDGPASTLVAPALVPARVVLAVFDADRGSADGPSLRRSRKPRPGAGHASQVPCKRCSATR
jgi:hypothetical protein